MAKMKLYVKLTLILIAFLAFSTPGTQAIKCYKCGAGTSISCGDSSLMPEECEGQSRGQKVDACQQSIDDKGDEKRTCIASREAMNTVTVDGKPLETGKCYMDARVGAKGFSLENKYKKFCTCYQDACNSVSKMGRGSYLWVVLSSASVASLLIRRWS